MTSASAASLPPGADDADGVPTRSPVLPVGVRTLDMPSPSDPGYAAALTALVRAESVGVVVPCADEDATAIAAMGSDLADAGALALVSTPAFVALAADKLETVGWCRAHGIDTPRTWSATELSRSVGGPRVLGGGGGGDTVDSLPERLFVRPRWGSGSRGARRMSRHEFAAMIGAGGARDGIGESGDLDEFRGFGVSDELVVSEEVRLAELTIDSLFDLDGRLVHWSPRLRVALAGGRSVESVVVDRPILRRWVPEVLTRLGAHGARGLVSFQAFHSPHRPLLIEVNARLAHGLPTTIASGADHAEWALQLVEGLRPDVAPGLCHARD